MAYRRDAAGVAVEGRLMPSLGHQLAHYRTSIRPVSQQTQASTVFHSVEEREQQRYPPMSVQWTDGRGARFLGGAKMSRE